MPNPGSAPPVAIVMGSRSDWPTMQCAAESLDLLGVPYETKVVSAHRTPERLPMMMATGGAEPVFGIEWSFAAGPSGKRRGV